MPLRRLPLARHMPCHGRAGGEALLAGRRGLPCTAALWRVAYRTQRAAKPIDRVLLRRDRILFRKLKGDDPGYVPKPKWMRRKTYERWHAKLDQAEEQLDAYLAGMIGRLGELNF